MKQQSYSWQDKDGDRARLSTDAIEGDAIAMLELVNVGDNLENAVYLNVEQAGAIITLLDALIKEHRRS